MSLIIIICIAGFLLSAYSFYVEKKLEKNKKYKAVCDISDHMSCTAAAKSKYSAVGGVPNSVKGMFFYPFMAVLALVASPQVVFYLASASLVMTVYLIYVSYFKLKNYCLVCSSVYLVNILLFYFSYVRM
ncbi:hypothetical protein HZC31_01555 [Candidatus Woesearchaeota archaeon]|nr:hypothetical protein [Candidatus Woesearchaeota archaeon]